MPMADDASSGESLTAERSFGIDDVQGAGVVQGGIVAGVLADVVAAFAAAGAAPGTRVELETLTVALERPARPGPVRIVATPTRRGRSVAAWDARLVDDAGRTIATARTTFRVEAA